MSLPDFSKYEDDELRTLGDEIYEDLIDAAKLCPNTNWHDCVFGALLSVCDEMQKRGFPPPTERTGVLQ